MIILDILKIIGIILASILGILLLTILVVLFCPIRYHVFGTERYNNDGNDSNIIVKVSWLLHLIGLEVAINPNVSMYLRVLFIKKKLGDKKNSDKENSDTNDSETDASENNEIESNKTEKLIGNDEYPDEENVNSENTNNINNSDNANNSDASDNTECIDDNEDASEEHKKSPKEKLLKLEEIIQKVKDIINNPIYKEAIIKIKDELINLLKAIIPYKLFLKAKFSTGSPDTTGIALGIIAMFPIGYQNRWKIEPDFESDNVFIDSSFDIKGKIYFYKVLAIAIRLFIDKNCRKLYNDIRR